MTIKLHLKRALGSLLMVTVLATGSIEIFLPTGTRADLIAPQNSNISTAQENTILQTNPADSYKVAKRIKMVVTAYSSTVEQTDSTPFITASGQTVRDGIVANNLLSFGTKVRIPSLYGNKVFTVQDRMNKRKGDYHLDIWMDSTKEAKNFGSDIVYIEVLED